METKNELQRTEESSPNQMIQLAIESNADLGKVEKLLELKERYEANEARKVFASDFAIVQASIVAVVKTKVNPQTHSKYAGLENVLEIAKPVYTKHGFSIIFYEGETEVSENIRVCANVLHKSGHKETYHFDVPLDGVGIKGNANMTKIHGKASSVSYGRRYLLCMIWNIPTEDDDGNGNNKKPKPEPDKPSEKNLEVLAMIAEALEPSKGKKVDIDKLGALFYSILGQYPSKPEAVEGAVQWVIGQNCEDRWTVKEPANLLSKSGEQCEKLRQNAYTSYCNKYADKITDPKHKFDQSKLDDAMRKILGKMPTTKAEVATVLGQIKPEDIIIELPF